jgi:hypothetical protein
MIKDHLEIFVRKHEIDVCIDLEGEGILLVQKLIKEPVCFKQKINIGVLFSLFPAVENELELPSVIYGKTKEERFTILESHVINKGFTKIDLIVDEKNKDGELLLYFLFYDQVINRFDSKNYKGLLNKWTSYIKKEN